jgi:WD40 repeat protein
MCTSIRRAAAVVAAGAALGALGISGVSAAGAATQASQQAARPGAVHGLAVPGARLWVQRYNGSANGDDGAKSVAVSPDGTRVFVIGVCAGATPCGGYTTVAYSAATGAQLWAAPYNPANSRDIVEAVAVSPDGGTVFVTGISDGGTGSGFDYATVAYRASDGTQLWAARFNGPFNGDDEATSLSVARDGGAVFVTGASQVSAGRWAHTTVAYRASDGTQLWVRSFAPGIDGRGSIVSPGGNRVFVTGHVTSKANTGQYGTVAYNAATGAQLWARRYTGLGGKSIAASPDGTRVYVTGESHSHYGTLAYSARTGAQLWARFYGVVNASYANSVAVSPRGTVLVTGSNDRDYGTVAYSPAGSQLWARRYNSQDNDMDIAYSVAAPGNGKVYVTGTTHFSVFLSSSDYGTIAYNIFTGARLWVRPYNGPGNGDDAAYSVAARAGRVFVTGTSEGTTSGSDWATIAYNG